MPIDQKDPTDEISVSDRHEGYVAYTEYLSKKKDTGTVGQWKAAREAFEEFLQMNGHSLGDVGRSEANAFFEFLKRYDLTGGTAARYATWILKYFRFLISVGVLEWNPVALEYDSDLFEEQENTRKLHVPLDELREGLIDIRYPTTYARFFTALKTGMRRGEIANLDRRDVHLKGPIADSLPKPRAEIRDKPNSIFIPANITKGEEYNGEVRAETNKRKQNTVIPIDDELHEVLTWYFSLSLPPLSPAKPVFVAQGTTGQGRQALGGRLQGGSFYNRVTNWAEKQGWCSDSDHVDGVTPHWARHWFTTHLRNRIDEEELKGEERSQSVERYVKGLRGDTGDDVIDTYTHDWGEKPWLRDAYLNNIPKLLVPPIND